MSETERKRARGRKEQGRRLPSPPHVLSKIIAAATADDVSVVKLGKIAGSDPVFAAELLRVANSSLYRRGSNVTSVLRAVSVLGARSLRNHALCAAARSCVHQDEMGAFDLDRFWEDSMRRAVAAQSLAGAIGSLDPGVAFTVGLLLDFGVLPLIMGNPERAARWNDVAGATSEQRRDAEREMFGATHDEVAKNLSKTWSLPEELALPMCHHHDTERSGGNLSNGYCELGHWAEILAGVLICDDKTAALHRARTTLKHDAGLPDAAVEKMISELGGQVEETARVLGMKVGPQDSLESILRAANEGLVEMNLDYEELVTALERTTRKLEDALREKDNLARKLVQKNSELEKLSVTDPLTSLPNRRAFWSRIVSEIERIARSGDSLILMIGDIDHFKQFNDTHGHEFGDRVLIAMAMLMSSTVRTTDLVARIGGEEFSILLPATERVGGMVAAEKLMDAIRSHHMTAPDGSSSSIRISLGLVELKGPFTKIYDPEVVMKRLYKAADASLYVSKHGGRDQVTDYPKEIKWQSL